MTQTFQRDNETIPTSDRIPVLPLRDVVIFPYVVIPLLVGRPASLAAIEAALAEDKILLLVAQRDGEKQEPAAADLHRTGVVGRVVQVSRLPTGTTRVLVEGVARARITRYIPSGNMLRAAVTPAPFDGPAAKDAAETEALSRRVLNSFEEYVSLHRRIPPEVVSIIQSTDSAERQAFGVAAHVAVRFELRQSLLEAETLRALLEMLAELLSGEIELLRLERKIDDDVRGAMFQNQREFYLQEQLRVIHRELGEEDSDDFADLETQVRKKSLPKHVEDRTLRELRKLRKMPPMSPEFTVARNFVDWIVSIPWTERTDEVLDVANARTILDADHYGLDEVKDRILDFIAVMSLVGRLDGQILCLVGPPGVGKTSLGRSIARALGRKFVRMALGGVRDEAEIRGHRRTYIGSMPGKVLQSLTKAGTRNPLFLLDEIDKLGMDFRGDPSSALLEVLDPEQNHTFSDHYVEVDFDLSDTMFIATSNSMNIPPALLDRMEVIRLSGYTEDEKLNIALRYLLPKQSKNNGVREGELEVTESAVRGIVRYYTREAGVRSLEREISKICRKVVKAAQLKQNNGKVVVTEDNLNDYLGVRKYDFGMAEKKNQVGQVVGLAWTEVGGDLLTIESAVMPGKGNIIRTGQLGDVMKESVEAARSVVRSRARRLGIKDELFEKRDVHIHVPDGATPKDGPSAGIAMTTAFVSALTGIPVRATVAMTGEITLRGEVTAIGGLKEKLLAAHRGGIKTVMIPEENVKDLQDIPENVKNHLEIVPVRWIDRVLEVALETMPQPLPEDEVQKPAEPVAAAPAAVTPPVASTDVRTH